MLPPALAGLGFGLSLIIAIGAQNAFVLRQGLRQEHVGPIVALCALSDLVLILAGVGGMGAAIQRMPILLLVIRFGGAAFLIGYAVLAARRALRPDALTAETTGPGLGLGQAVATAAALTWLNPHVYLDTVVLLGSVANTHRPHQWAFATGASIGSVLWFSGLGFGARLLGRVFARPMAWRVLDGAIALVMLGLGVRLLIG
ncbi:amino acid transporter [Naumannella sp. ID2617S]|uniref:Amino acid transporter n=1 Tax=Enemella dayhoffiae TaxID=2016507 RepID=A0A255H607_9ACTN|nr:amino acid transporter [Naumannella sp. ID2617S]OYO23160.1 amino acid transporter [Enemella dayhoffiae]